MDALRQNIRFIENIQPHAQISLRRMPPSTCC
jgi:hypothetical protein